jgi:hypothetical protein
MVSAKENLIYAEMGRKLMHNPPEYLHRRLQEMPNQSQQGTQETIPVQRILAQYGQTHLQLVVANETIDKQNQYLSSLSQQLKDALAKLAEYEANATAKKPEAETQETVNS